MYVWGGEYTQYITFLKIKTSCIQLMCKIHDEYLSILTRTSWRVEYKCLTGTSHYIPNNSLLVKMHIKNPACMATLKIEQTCPRTKSRRLKLEKIDSIIMGLCITLLYVPYADALIVTSTDDLITIKAKVSHKSSMALKYTST